MAESGATARPDGALVVKRHDPARYEKRLAELVEAFDLGPGVTTWATVRVEDGAEPVLQVNAHTRGVRVVKEVKLPADVRKSLEAAMEDAQDNVRAALKLGVARTIASSEMFGGDD